ncbi:hypothetical protein E2C01_054172 [Portunus trituberculatus]|uniref:Uncharacterized protein n=1 Tax=Portunus trituberculatus TaxID=210409 RepID=A0A5B7GS23_PORTR|nr:hypothetical protein [Portunus trituberculatus]
MSRPQHFRVAVTVTPRPPPGCGSPTVLRGTVTLYVFDLCLTLLRERGQDSVKATLQTCSAPLFPPLPFLPPSSPSFSSLPLPFQDYNATNFPCLGIPYSSEITKKMKKMTKIKKNEFKRCCTFSQSLPITITRTQTFPVARNTNTGRNLPVRKIKKIT